MITLILDILAYIGIMLTALFAHMSYSVNLRTPKYAILSIFVSLFTIFLFAKFLKERKITFSFTKIHIFWLTFSFISLVSTINVLRYNPEFFRRSFDVALYIFLNVVLSFYISNFMKNRKKVENYLFVFMLTGFIIGLNGILNYYTSYDIFMGVVEGLLYRDRIKSTIGNVIFVANYLNMLLPISFYFIFKNDSTDSYLTNKKIAFLGKIFALLNTMLYLFILTIAQVRSEFLAWILEGILLVAFFILFYLKNKQSKFALANSRFSIIALILLVVWFIVISYLFYFVPSPINNYGDLGGAGVTQLERLEKGSLNRDKTIRQVAWTSAINLWKKHKLIGNGINSYQILGSSAVSDVANSRPEYNFAWQPFDTVHNDYLQVLTETGIFGFTTIVLILIFLLPYVFKNLEKLIADNDKNNTILFVSLVLSGVVFAVQAFFSPVVQILPNALLANFVISTGLGIYFNKLGMKSAKLESKAGLVVFLIVLIAIFSSAYLRTTHYLSEFYYGRARVAGEFLSTFEDQEKSIKEKLRNLEKAKESSQVTQNEYEEAKKKLQDELNNTRKEIEQAYLHGKEAYIKSIKFDRTSGMSFFYFSGFAYHPLRIQKLSQDIEKNYKEILSQNYDDIQKIIDKKEKRTDLLFLANYISNNPSVLKYEKFVENLLKAQVSLDSLALFSTALKTYAEPNTYSLIARRYQVLCESLDELSKNAENQEIKNALIQKKNEYFEKLVDNGKKLFYFVSGGWYTYPAYKNTDIELATVSGEDMHRSIANYVLMSKPDSFEILYETLKEIAKKEIETCLNVEKQNIYGIPTSVLPYIHTFVELKIKQGDEKKAFEILNELLELYREPYLIACKRLENTEYYLQSFRKFQDIIDKRLSTALRRKPEVLKKLTDEVKKVGNESFEELTKYDFKNHIRTYIDTLTKEETSNWAFIGLTSPWKLIIQSKIQNITFSSLALTGSLEIFGKVGSALSGLMNSKFNQSVFLFERYMMLKVEYEMLEELKSK